MEGSSPRATRASIRLQVRQPGIAGLKAILENLEDDRVGRLGKPADNFEVREMREKFGVQEDVDGVSDAFGYVVPDAQSDNTRDGSEQLAKIVGCPLTGEIETGDVPCAT
ncbi:hypothetical protein MKEN_00897100 [Mycena kentingensis (nom. inval.)]|nr:hypothetical protein MKEN_00897100 [Mycena kentingensis (nom. inval.)]